MNLSMTPAQLRELTGRTFKIKQIEWLVAHGWVYVPNCFGQPIVSLDYYNMRMGSVKEADQPSTQPNWGTLT